VWQWLVPRRRKPAGEVRPASGLRCAAGRVPDVVVDPGRGVWFGLRAHCTASLTLGRRFAQALRR
jgi:hypothetical protein